MRLGQVGRRLLVGTAPDALEVVAAHIPLLVHGAVKLGGMVCLGVQFDQRRGPRLILVGRSGNLLARAAFDDSRIVPGAAITKFWSDC